MTTSLSGVNYKGFTVQNLLAYTAERFDEETVRLAIESLPPDLRTYTNPQMTLAVGWVPVETYFGIVQHVVNQHFGGNVAGAETIGYEVTMRDIHSIFKAVLRFTTPGMVLGMAKRMWRSYCDQGELQHVEEAGKSVLTLKNFAYQTPLALGELAGGFKAYLKCSSAKNPRVEVMAPDANGSLRWLLISE